MFPYICVPALTHCRRGSPMTDLWEIHIHKWVLCWWPRTIWWGSMRPQRLPRQRRWWRWSSEGGKVKGQGGVMWSDNHHVITAGHIRKEIRPFRPSVCRRDVFPPTSFQCSELGLVPSNHNSCRQIHTLLTDYESHFSEAFPKSTNQECVMAQLISSAYMPPPPPVSMRW